MKLAQHSNALETNAEVKSQDFGIGDASVVIEILRNRLYSHPIRTLVQEYMSNGRDAMREAKTKDRIVVSVPNHISPVFKVRDFGPGISPQRMVNVFIKYGASTKRSTNGQTGGFGIGAKSAWSYTDSFTIVSITDGTKRTYVAHTGVNNQGRLDLLSEVKTDEANGAEIQVAVKPNDIGEFQNSIWRTCYFWKDEEYPKFKGVTSQDIPQRKTPKISLTQDGKRIDLVLAQEVPHYLRLDAGYYGKTCSVVVDGIPYNISEKITNGAKNLIQLTELIKCHAHLHISNGDVEVSASRENIADSETTRSSLNTLAGQFCNVLGNHIRSEFKGATTNAQWIAKYKELHLVVSVDAFTKRGDYTIANNCIDSAFFRDFDLYIAGENVGRRGRGGFKRDKVNTVHLEYLNSIFYLDDLSEPIVTQNRRIKEYLQANKQARTMLIVPVEKKDFIAQKDKTGKPMLDANNNPMVTSKVRVSLANSVKSALKVQKDLGAIDLSTQDYTLPVRVPKAKQIRTKEMFTIHVCTHGHKSPDTKTIEDVEAEKNEKYLYIKFDDFAKYESEFKDVGEFVASLGWEICALTEKSIEVASLSDRFTPYAEWKSKFKITDKILTACFAKKALNTDAMKALAPTQIKVKDKLLAKMLDQYQAIVKNDVCQPPETIMKMVKDEVKEFTENDAELTKLLKASYPLVGASANFYGIRSGALADELVIYINAKI